MDLMLAGKNALVTGATKGIGRATAELLATEGCHLELAARTADDLEQLAAILRQTHGIEVRTHAVDLAKSEDQERLATACADVDIAINNAGSNPAGEITDVDETTWRASWDLKVFGYVNLCRAFYGAMSKRGEGVIVNIIGNAGERMNAMYILGTAGNSALMAMTQALGARAPDFGVRVVGVNPGMTATDRGLTMLRSWSEQKYGTPERWQEFEKGLNLPFSRMATPEELANVIVFAASPRASYVSGTVITVDGGAVNRNF